MAGAISLTFTAGQPADMIEPRDRPDRSRARRRTTARALVLLVAFFLVVVAAGSSSPAVCGSCHAMRPYSVALSSSSHHSVPCYSCHLPSGAWSWPGFKARELLEMYPAAALGATVTAAADLTPSAPCLACHASVLDEPVALHGLRIAHASCATGAACDSCHSAVAHGARRRSDRRPDMDACVACHLDRSATTACDACHALRTQAGRLAGVAWRSTHGPAWLSTHGKGDIALCRTCHATTFCVGCHGIALPHPASFSDVHGGYSQVASARCGECHDRATFCDPCHRMPMPHPDGYFASHPTSTDGSRDDRCPRCHAASDCQACHQLHTHVSNTKGTIGSFKLPALTP
jgi:cytochrome c nitrite reductase small subunit